MPPLDAADASDTIDTVVEEVMESLKSKDGMIDVNNAASRCLQNIHLASGSASTYHAFNKFFRFELKFGRFAGSILKPILCPLIFARTIAKYFQIWAPATNILS